MDFTLPAPWSAPKALASQSLRPPAAWSRARPSACWRSSPIPTSSRPPTTCPKSWRISPSAWRAWTDCSSSTPPGGGWLLAEFGAQTHAEAEAQARALMDALGRSAAAPNMHLCTQAEARHVWTVRESSLGVISHVPGEPLSWEGWEDSAVAPEKLGNYLRDLLRLMGKFGYHGTLYGHFGHACVHTRLNF